MNRFSFTHKGRQRSVILRENASDYDSDDLMQILETAVLATPKDLPANRRYNGFFFLSANPEITVCFDRYGGKVDKLIRVERIDSRHRGSAFRIRIKRPHDSLSDLELMGAAGAIEEGDPLYTAKMPIHWRVRLFNELFTAVKISTYSRANVYEAMGTAGGIPLPEVRALEKRIKSSAETKVADAWIQLKSKKDWYLGDQGIELQNYITSRVKHMKYLLRRAEIVGDQNLIEALTACIKQIEALGVATGPLSTYTRAAKAIINNHEE